jgi:CubicO group peptidase (beta-lactamase class C family)
VGSGATAVLIGDAVTYGGFAVLGMAYRRRSIELARRRLAVGAAAACAATIAIVRFAGLPAGGVNESYAAVALTGIGWLLAAGAAEARIRRLAERRRVRSITGALTRRAVTIYLWHPAAIVVAYAVLKGFDRFPPMSMVKHWPAPAVLVIALTAVTTAVAASALGWVEDVAARRSQTGRRQVAKERSGKRAVRLAAVLPPAATALAVLVPSLVVPVADGEPASAAPVLSAPRPPSFRAALSDKAFAARPTAADSSLPLSRVDPARARLQAALERWLEQQPWVDAVAVGAAVEGRIWTGSSHRSGSAVRLLPEEQFGALSMTKTFTAALVLHQVQAGRLSLDGPAPRIAGVPVAGDAAAVTVRQLLDHSSGLIDYGAAPGFDRSRPVDAREAVRLALAAGLRNAPGAEVHYSNTNYLYLGLVLEQVTGRPYGDLLTGLFEAHGLGTSRLGPGGLGWPGFASGGVLSTLDDLARWGDALFAPGRVLPGEMVEQLTTLDDKNMALAMWPLCPCGTSEDGTKQYTAIGQTVGYGGILRFPSGLTLIVRFDRVPEPIDAAVVTLGQEIEKALRAANSAGRP